MKGSLKTAGYLFNYVWKRNKILLVLMIVEQLISASLPIVMIVFPKLIIDELMNQKSIPRLAMYVASFGVLVFAINFLAKYLWKVNFVKMEGTLRFKFDEEIGAQVANLEFKYLEMPEILDLKEKAHNSMYSGPYDQFAGALTSLLRIISQAVVLLTISGIIVTLNPLVLLLLIAIFYANFRISKWGNKQNYSLSVEKTPYTRQSEYFKTTMGDFSFGKEIRMNNLSTMLLNNFKQNRDAENSLNKKSYANNYKVSTVASVTSFIQMIGVYGYLIISVVFKAMTIGNFTMYFSAISQFSQSVGEIVNNFLELNKIGYTLTDLNKFMSLEKVTDIKKTAEVPTEKLIFEFVDVSFRYPNSERFVLENVNLKIDFSEKLSIVGFNGAGKTTFVKLLTRLYKPTQGKILLNGIDINSFDFNEYMALFSVVFQDFKLFCFTIKDNITIGKEGNGKSFDEAVEESGLRDKIDRLPKKADTYIYKIFDESGIEPSGGEGQKMAIARALYKNSPVVILDEPTAALDPLAEYEIYRSLDRLAENKTAIYISHRLSSTRFCDKVAVFENGKIVEYGTHDSLIEINGLYADMYLKQAQYYV